MSEIVRTVRLEEREEFERFLERWATGNAAHCRFDQATARLGTTLSSTSGRITRI